MPTDLIDLEIDEVSLVDRPANSERDASGNKIPRARIALFKRDPDSAGLTAANKGAHRAMLTIEQIEKQLNEQQTALAALTADNTVLKAENVLVIGMSNEQRVAYADMSAEVRKQYVAGDVTKREALMAEAIAKGKNAKKVAAMDQKTRARYEKAGKEEQQAMLDACDSEDGDEEDIEMKKADQEVANLRLQLAAANDRVAKTEQAIVKTDSEIADIRKANRLQQFIKMAEAELPNTVGSPIEKGEMLMGLADTAKGGETGDVFKRYLDSLKSADAAIALSMKEIGKHGGGTTQPEPVQMLHKKAEEIAKRDGVTNQVAFGKAMLENPELYEQYERSRQSA